MLKKSTSSPVMATTKEESVDSVSQSLGDQIPKGNIIEFHQFSGSIPQERTTRYQWLPIEGALLVSGVMMADECAFLDGDLFDLMRAMTNIPAYKVKNAQYVFNKWSETNDKNQPISPECFLKWFNENPIPQLNFLGRPIKAQVIVNMPESDEVSDAKALSAECAEVSPRKAKEPLSNKMALLTTWEIGFVFDGVGGWTSNNWMKNISQSNWAIGSRKFRGKKGPNGSARWHPIELALAAIGRERGTLAEWGRAFRRQKRLLLWLDAWKEEEEKLRYYLENT